MVSSPEVVDSARMADPIHRTTALCPVCDEVLPAELVEREGDVAIEMRCPSHGAASSLYFRDASLYRELLAERNAVACCDEYRCARGEPCTERLRNTMIFIVNVTNNCNMTCEACFSGSVAAARAPYVSADELLAPLPDAAAFDFPPHLVMLGGEPTLHPDLPRIISDAVKRGYIPRLASNGLKLRRERYARALAEAGLRWVFLHFDSFDDALNSRLRGRPMLQACMDAIRTCRKFGMKVQFGVTVSRENIGELKQLLEGAHRAGVFWISLYTLAEIERTGQAGATFLADAINALEQQTSGEVRRSDFVAATRVWSKLFALSGRMNYRQKPTMVSLPVIFDRGRMVPVTRLLRPSGALRNAAALGRLARAVPSLVDYENREPSGDTLVVNIQQFQGRSAFDLSEATHSLMSFVHNGSFVPFDVFNHVHRYGDTPLIPSRNLLRASA